VGIAVVARAVRAAGWDVDAARRDGLHVDGDCGGQAKRLLLLLDDAVGARRRARVEHRAAAQTVGGAAVVGHFEPGLEGWVQ